MAMGAYPGLVSAGCYSERCEQAERRLDGDTAAWFILASGYSDQEISQRFQNAGLAGFIEKPYWVETLGAKHREVLAQHS